MAFKEETYTLKGIEPFKIFCRIKRFKYLKICILFGCLILGIYILIHDI